MNNQQAGTPDIVAADVRRLTVPASNTCGLDSSRRFLQPQALAFTLIEMLVVTAIISILAALIFPVAGSVKKARDLRRTRAELMLVAQAIDGYKDKLGHYPPDCGLSTNTDALKYQHNQLFYELRGTTLVGTSFSSLDGSTSIATNSLPPAFGTDGFVNCTRGAGGDEAQPALKFLPELKAGQYVDTPVNGPTCRLLGCSLDGPNAVTDPSTSRKFSPWSYNASSPTNNPNSFDLWVDIQIGSKIYRISNWSTTPQAF